MTQGHRNTNDILLHHAQFIRRLFGLLQGLFIRIEIVHGVVIGMGRPSIRHILVVYCLFIKVFHGIDLPLYTTDVTSCCPTRMNHIDKEFNPQRGKGEARFGEKAILIHRHGSLDFGKFFQFF